MLPPAGASTARPRASRALASLEEHVEDLEQENQRLETQIAPFRALAVERFGKDAEEALVKLAAQVRDLEIQLERAGGVRRLKPEAAVA